VYANEGTCTTGRNNCLYVSSFLGLILSWNRPKRLLVEEEEEIPMGRSIQYFRFFKTWRREEVRNK
jgi:hypothetical protein